MVSTSTSTHLMHDKPVFGVGEAHAGVQRRQHRSLKVGGGSVLLLMGTQLFHPAALVAEGNKESQPSH